MSDLLIDFFDYLAIIVVLVILVAALRWVVMRGTQAR
jgi:hypothetical protein